MAKERTPRITRTARRLGLWARGDSLSRQLKLIQLLDERREVRVPEVARELGYTVRTVYRDLTVLQNVGVPLYQERSGARARWRLVDGYRRTLKLTLTLSEMLALTTGRELLSGTSGSMFHEAAITALEKIRAALPPELVRRADAVARTLTASPGEARDYSLKRGVIQTLVEAVEANETLQMHYRKPRERMHSDRLFDPYHLHVQAGAIYVIGFDHTRRESRTFLVDRIMSLERTARHFDRQQGFVATEYSQGAFGPWAGRALELRLRFKRDVAPWIAERKMHPSQTSQWHANGALDVSMKVPISPALVHWLVGFGCNVAVLAPAQLAERVHREHKVSLDSAAG